jgi:FAD/FMN-containing dehydrogenase
VRQLRDCQPGMTLRAIAERLASEGFFTPSGKAYGPSAIARLLID